MPLERHRQVARVWDWLPAFRAIAEYESLQRAALALAVSPSALSRSIKLLEAELGEVLFVRSPTGLTLTAHGHRLLDGARAAMRLVHDALPAAARPRELRVGAVGAVLERLLFDAALLALPDWSLRFSSVQLSEVSERLRCGDLDLVLTFEPVAHDSLRSMPLPALELALASRPGVGDERVGVLDAAGFGWPEAALTALSVDQLLAAAERLPLALHLPRCLLSTSWTVHSITRTLPTFAVHRVEVAPSDASISRVVEALATRLRENSAQES
jgi:DNA-binding transcriptional LysR family regulator